tara:strand:- start:2273 stop:3010 length:738 start_codon:yes stop_codon:yes gene_type:complete
MQQRYDPHIRVKFALFDDPQFRSIPENHRSHAYLVFICLLKFANSKTLTCYPRKATIADMSGLSRTTIYRATLCLEKAGIIKKKRLKSTLLYTINPKYIVGYKPESSQRNIDVSERNMGVSVRPLLEELSYRTNINTSINLFIKGLSGSGSDNERIIEELANKYPPEQLKKAIIDKDNPYFCKKALEVQEDKNKTYVHKNIILKAVDDVRKKTNYFYKNKVAKNKDKYGRISATKNFLSKSYKKD